jgi:hypothetical protein
MAAAGCGEKKTDLSQSKIGIARLEAKEFACTAYTQFRAETRNECPTNLDELLPYLSRRDLEDPWGNDYVMLCGDDKPAEAGPCLGVRSHGPDGKANTPDDVTSWDKPQ